MEMISTRIGLTIKAGLAAAFTLVSLQNLAAAQELQAADFADDVLQVARSELQSWITDPIIIYAIREQNELNTGLTDRQVARLDKRWRAGGALGPMVGDLMDRQASVILRDRRALSNGLITEIIVMDEYGLNVAISDPTSDFFQGDEEKWTETYLKGKDAVHVSELEFDESTQKVQTQVSLPVMSPDTGELIGAVTFGINLEYVSN